VEVMQTALAPTPDARPFSAAAALRDALRAWGRNPWTLSGATLITALPGVIVELSWPATSPESGLRLALGQLLSVASSLVATTALAAGGLAALRGGRPELGAILRRGVASAWRLLLVSVRAFPLGAVAALAFLAAMSFLASPAQGQRPTGWFLAAGVMVLLACLVLVVGAPLFLVRAFPLPAVLLEEPGYADAELIRRARDLTQGRRWRVLALLLPAVLVMAAMLASYLLLVQRGRVELPSWTVAATLIDALVWAPVQILPAAAYLHLAHGEGGPAAELGRVFD
jgi:hypothetical protein